MKKTIRVKDIWNEIERFVKAEREYLDEGSEDLASDCETSLDTLLVLLTSYARARSASQKQWEGEYDDIFYHYFELREKYFTTEKYEEDAIKIEKGKN